jgi:outer membrane receptor protein involved in Fe transport
MLRSLRPAITLSLLLTITTALQAQPLTIQGRIIDDQTGLPLANANIISGTQGTQTNAQGKFILTIVAGDSLHISFIGYKTLTLIPENSILELRLVPTILTTQGIVVKGGLTDQPLDQVATSVTVLNPEQWQNGDTHLQNLTASVPNLSWAGGTSRPRYFQIRGMGERSQFAGQGAPNFSVGFVMDDVDLSGLGMAGILFDLEQIEVFKGPQSTRFGPNAMAGLINLQSTDPTTTAARSAAFSVGNDGLVHFAGTVNIPLGQRLAVRAGYHQSRANGFRDNQFLGKDDTNRRHENLGRVKARYIGANGLILRGTFFRADLNNGYDAWTTDNNEELITYSDKPGKDNQLTTAFSFKGEMPLPSLNAELVSITAYSTTDLEYSFDGDWGNDPYWLAEPFNYDPAVEGFNYDFFDRTLRQRDTFTQEIRLINKGLGGGNSQALIGAYFKDLQEQDNATGFLFGGEAEQLTSTFEIDNLAFYGQYSRTLADLRLSLNLRLDRNKTRYDGTTDNDVPPIQFDQNQWLLGGKAALTYILAPGYSAYASVSRGYRAGGVNQHPRLAAQNRPYDSEYIVNLEAGFRAHTERVTTALTLFHSLRSDQQVNLSNQQDPGDPNSFFFFTANASKGRSSGLELEQTYQLISALQLFGSLGYLSTHINAYTFPNDDGTTQTLGNRNAAHAPQYTARIGSAYKIITDLTARLELSATDTFFYSDSHNQKSDAYQLLNGSLSYRTGPISLTLWGRNLLDERYGTRGFFFGLEPPNYNDKLYISYGDPRQVGLNTAIDF